jgi:hypothetical protein
MDTGLCEVSNSQEQGDGVSWRKSIDLKLINARINLSGIKGEEFRNNNGCLFSGFDLNNKINDDQWICVYSVDGVERFKIKKRELHTVRLKNIQSGMYVLVFRNDDAVIVKRILVL